MDEEGAPPFPRRIAITMTDFRKPSASTEDRPLLGVPEVEALTGIPAKIIRANVRNGLLKARMAGSTTMRIRRVDLDAWLDALPAWHE